MIMQARDVMTRHAICVGPDLPVQAVANTLVKNGISAVPVVSMDGKLVGIVSEGDLMRRVETGTERRHSWWLEMISSRRNLAAEFAKSHGLKAQDVMTTHVITAHPDTPLQEVADLMERNGVKRLPIVEDGAIVGIISRANLVQALASGTHDVPVDDADENLRQAVIDQIEGKPWAEGMVNVIVRNGVVSLWGVVDSEDERKAVRVVAECTPGVRSVNDNLRVVRMSTGE
jgi:CBS domain-containing protein